MPYQKTFYIFIILLVLSIGTVHAANRHPWKSIDKGFAYGEFQSPSTAVPGKSYPFVVLRIDPKIYHFKLLCASQHEGKLRTVKQWCRDFRLLAAINASMYKKDNYVQSTGYMKTSAHINNPSINQRFGAFMVFDPLKSSLPRVQIIDRYYQDWGKWVGQYGTVIQNYRLISLKRENLWKPSQKMYSTAVVGIDKMGRVLFIFCRMPMSTHDFNNAILALPLDIKNAMYVEGGPEATLYFSSGGHEKEWVGSFETNFLESDENHIAWRVPNVIGVVKRESF